MTKSLKNPAAFFDSVRGGILGPSLDKSEVDGCNAVLSAVGADGWPISWAAYALATAYHETAHTMQPIKEFGGPKYFFRMYDPQGERPHVAADLGNTQPGDGVAYCGRGYVQLTGRANYRKAGGKVGADLEHQPDLAMKPDIAAKVMVAGMRDGWFTGKSCKSYMPADKEGDTTCFTSARAIINRQDRAADIAGYAIKFQNALKAGGWS